MTRGGKRPGAGRPQNNPKEALTHVLRVTDSEKDFIQFSRVKKIDLTKLKKTLLAIVFLFVLAMPVNAYTLKGGVEYTVDSARIVAFENTHLKISVKEFKADMYDPHFYSNVLRCIPAGITYDDFGRARQIVPFYKDNKLVSYGVKYDNAPARKYYYSPTGVLLKYEENTFKGVYPYKTKSYDTKGKLLTINLVISANESYTFDNNKKLIGHWINNICYDENNNIIVTKRP